MSVVGPGSPHIPRDPKNSSRVSAPETKTAKGASKVAKTVGGKKDPMKTVGREKIPPSSWTFRLKQWFKNLFTRGPKKAESAKVSSAVIKGQPPVMERFKKLPIEKQRECLQKMIDAFGANSHALLKTEGIFRVPGEGSQIVSLQAALLDQLETGQLAEVTSPMEFADAFKRFFVAFASRDDFLSPEGYEALAENRSTAEIFNGVQGTENKQLFLNFVDFLANLYQAQLGEEQARPAEEKAGGAEKFLTKPERVAMLFAMALTREEDLKKAITVQKNMAAALTKLILESVPRDRAAG